MRIAGKGKELFESAGTWLLGLIGDDRSRIEDQLALDGADISSFATAAELWERFQARPARLVITARRFGDDFDGLELVSGMEEAGVVRKVT